jgi:hypothetical protein
LADKKADGSISTAKQEKKFLKGQDKAFNKMMKTTSSSIINQVNGNMSNLEGSLNIQNVEVDANNRAQETIGPLPYNSQNLPTYNGKTLTN